MANIPMTQRDLPFFWATLAVGRLDAKFPSAALALALSNHAIHQASSARNALDAVGKLIANPPGDVPLAALDR